MADLFIILAQNIGIIAVMSIIISRLPFFRDSLHSDQIHWTHMGFLVLFFGGVGIFGTYAGVEVNDAVANSRVIGPFVGGLVGGPIVGLLSGLIAGLHRYAINPLGFSSLACVIITPLQGLIIGLLSNRIHQSQHRWQLALLLGAVAETVHMSFVVLLSRPLSQAIDLVEIIGPPMIITNSIGIAAFVMIIDSVMKDRQDAATHHAQRVLDIAKETLVHFRNGLNTESTTAVAKIILQRCNIDAVCFTDTTKVLNYAGIGAEFHSIGEPIQTTITKDVLASGEYRVGPHIHSSDCGCPIQSAVVVPIKVHGNIAGTFKIYKKEKHGITSMETQLALGLTALFNQQLELELVEKQSALLKEAKYHALQSQINPHFLFNALNTINSVVRTSPDRGRELLLSLSEYLRGNMNFSHDILLKEELDHVRAYLDIEQARFGDTLSVHFDVQTQSDLRLPPLTLQPLVENAIKHGLRTQAKGGSVLIKIIEETERFVLAVKDNGKGIDPEIQKKLLIAGANGDSVGLANIHQRLITRYGEVSGLAIESRLGEGTEVTFVIPQVALGETSI